MESLTKVSATVVSHVGTAQEKNRDGFYMNGRFMYEYETDNIQVSIENDESQYIFAVHDGLTVELPDKGSSISISRELKKVHEKIKLSSKGIEVKLDQICECAQDVSNLAYSASLENEGVNNRGNAFTGLIISENKAAVANTGECRAYFFRDGNVRQLPSDYKKTERLLKMGIITSEQAKMVSSQSEDKKEDEGDVHKSEIISVKEGDTFLLCSNGLTDVIGDDKISELLVLKEDTAAISNMLLKEVLRKGGMDDATIMVVRVEKATGEGKARHDEVRSLSRMAIKQINDAPKFSKLNRLKRKNIRRIASIAVGLVVVVGVFFGLYKLWASISGPRDGDVAPVTSQQPNPTPTPGDNNQGEGSGSTGQPAGEQDDTGESGGEATLYTVKNGDTLYGISKKFYNDYAKYKLIMEANGIVDENKIKVGQELVIPPAE